MNRPAPGIRIPRAAAVAGIVFLAACLPSASALAGPLGLRLEAGYRYSDNVTRAPQNTADVLSDQSLGLSVDKNFLFPLTERTRFIVNGFAGGEKFLEFDGLSNLNYGVQGTWQFRPSGSYSAPTYALFVRISGDQFQSSLRDGYRATAGVSVRKPLTDRIQVSATAAYNWRNATSAVFDQRDGSLRLNLDYALFGRSTLYFGGEYRRGDTVSTTRPSAALASIAKALETDDAFDDGVVRTAYRFTATTLIGTVGYNLAFGSGQSLDVSYRYIRSTPTDSIYGNYTGPWYGVASAVYVDHQVGVSYLVRF